MGSLVSCWQSRAYLSTLDLQLHVILAGRLAVLALLPAVAVPSVADLLPRVQQHRATLGSEEKKRSNFNFLIS